MRASRSPWWRSRLPLNPWGVVDQAFVSAANFGTTIMLARGLTPKAFGEFVLLFAVLLLIVSVQSSIISQPHNVFGATRTGADYAHYTGNVTAMEITFAMAIALLIGCLALVGFIAEWRLAPVLAALSPLVAAWLMQDFVRRALLTSGSVVAAFLNDVVGYGGQVAGILIALKIGTLDQLTAIIVLAVSSGLAFALGLWQIRRMTGMILHRQGLRETAHQHWDYGKWLLGGAILAWAAGGLYIALLVSGTVAAGAWRALYAIMGPVFVLIISMDSLIPAQVTRAQASGGLHAVRRFVVAVFVFTAPLVLIYGVIIALFPNLAIALLYGDRYDDYTWLLPLMGLFTLLAYIQQPIGLTLRGIGISQAIFRAQICSFAVAPVSGILLATQFGLIGAAVGMIVHYSLINIVLWKHFYTAVVIGNDEGTNRGTYDDVDTAIANVKGIAQ